MGASQFPPLVGWLPTFRVRGGTGRFFRAFSVNAEVRFTVFWCVRRGMTELDILLLLAVPTIS